MKFLSAFLATLLLLLPTPARAAAIVEGSVADILGIGVPWARIQFTPLSNPQAESGVIITSQPKTIASTADGLFSVPLEQGDYVVVIAGRDTFQISVPNTTNTYILQDLITTSLAYSYSQTPASGPADWYGAAVVLNTSTSNALRSSITALSGSSGSGLTTASNALRSSITANTASITLTSNVLRSDLTTVSNYALTSINSSSNLLQLQIDGITTSTNTSYSLTSTSNALRADITTLQADLTTTSNALRSGISANTSSITSTSNALRSDLTTVSNFALTSINSSSNLLQLQIDGISGSTNYSTAITTTSNALRADITTLQSDLTTTSNALGSDITTTSNALRSDITANASGITTTSNALQVQIDGISGSTNYANLVTTTSNALRSDITANASAITTTSNALRLDITANASAITTTSNSIQENLIGIVTNVNLLLASFTSDLALVESDLTTTSNSLQLQIDAVSGGTNYATAITTTSNVLRSDITANTSAITTTSNVLQADLTTTARWISTAAGLPAATNALVFTYGYSSAGDGGHGTYRRDDGSSAATNGITVHNCAAGGRYLLVHNGTISSKVAGLAADNTTDDHDRLAILFGLGTGYTIRLEPGTYRSVGGLTVAAGTHVIASGATLRCETTGLDRAVSLASETSWEGGYVKCDWQSGGVSGDDHCAFRIGEYTTGVGATNVTVRNVTVESTQPDQNGILVTGASARILLENINYPDSTTIGGVVTIHWGFNGDPTLGTYHPHDIVVRGLNTGNINGSGNLAEAVFVSASYNVTVENVSVKECKTAAMYVTGDYGYRYSGFTNQIVGNVVFRNIYCQKATYRALWASGIEEFTRPTTRPILFENCNLTGSRSSGLTNIGIFASEIRNVVFRNVTACGFQFGATIGANVERLTIEGGVIADCYYNGGLFHVSSLKNVLLSGITFENNCRGTGAAGAAGLYINGGQNIEVRNCRFGNAVSEGSQEQSIFVRAPATGVSLIGNHTRSVKSSGVNIAYDVGQAEETTNLSLFQDNTAASGITLTSGPANLPVLTRGALRVFTGSGAPTTGTFSAGDVIMANANFSAPWMWYCTLSGSPGTWVAAAYPRIVGSAVDADYTWTPNGNPNIVVIDSSTPLTANRTFTLSTTGAVRGMTVELIRNDSGAFAMSFAGKAVPANSSATAMFDVGIWRLIRFSTF